MSTGQAPHPLALSAMSSIRSGISRSTSSHAPKNQRMPELAQLSMILPAPRRLAHWMLAL
jgi:hypothetical protein